MEQTNIATMFSCKNHELSKETSATWSGLAVGFNTITPLPK